MKRFAMGFIALLVVSTTACVWAPAGGYQGGPLTHRVAHMPSTGLQPYQPRVPRFVGAAALLSLTCVAPNGWATPPQQKGSTDSRSESPLGEATIHPGAANVPCQKPAR